MAFENLIQLSFTAEELKKIDDSLAEIEKVLKGKTHNLTPEERKQYGSIAEQNKLFVNKAKLYMEQYPDYVPRYIDKAEFDKDYTAREVLESRMVRVGLKDEPWQFSMFITDFHFWAVLVINFALYYGFAWFADQFLTEKKNLQPDFVIQKEIEQVQNKIDALDGKVKELEQIINENKQKIKDLEGQIEQNKITIEKIKNLIIAYENGRIPIDASYLKSLISKYMEGYARYVSGKYKHDESKEKEIKDKIEEERNKWYKDKEESWV